MIDSEFEKSETEVLVVMVTLIRENEESMLNVSVSTEPDNTVLVRWSWSEGLRVSVEFCI